MTELTDEQIAHLVQTGDSEQFGELIERYETKLKRYARKFLNSVDDIEDLVQDVFIKSYTNIQSFDVKQRFSPWIYRIAHNTFVNELKRKHRRGFSIFDADTILPQLAAKETTDKDILDTEIRAELDELLTDLPTKYREVIILFYFEELSYQEISEVLQIPVTTVGVRMNRGRTKLRSCYEERQKLTQK
jgi:RNA polymerase sigma-70 factor (ECF subfamily)